MQKTGLNSTITKRIERAKMDGRCMSWDASPEEVSPSGIAKRVIQGEQMSLVMIRVPGGIMSDRHSHPHEQFVHVVTGSGVLETAQGQKSFAAGTVFHFPPNTWHAARFDSDAVLIETNLITGPATNRHGTA